MVDRHMRKNSFVPFEVRVFSPVWRRILVTLDSTGNWRLLRRHCSHKSEPDGHIPAGIGHKVSYSFEFLLQDYPVCFAARTASNLSSSGTPQHEKNRR